MPKANHRCKDAPTKYPAHRVTRITWLLNRDRAKREFEAWAAERGLGVLHYRGLLHQEYFETDTELSWQCWLSSRMVAAEPATGKGA
jgi:hypothetical protein